LSYNLEFAGGAIIVLSNGTIIPYGALIPYGIFDYIWGSSFKNYIFVGRVYNPSS